MSIIVDDRDIVAGGYAHGFDREGVSSAEIEASEFREWIGKISNSDMNAVEAFVIGDCNEREALSRLIRERLERAVLMTASSESTTPVGNCSIGRAAQWSVASRLPTMCADMSQTIL